MLTSFRHTNSKDFEIMFEIERQTHNCICMVNGNTLIFMSHVIFLFSSNPVERFDEVPLKCSLETLHFP